MKIQRGFTLLEMLIALAVFAVMAAVAYRGLGGILEARQALDEESDRIARLRFAVALIERDLRQALPRGVRDALGDPEPALSGDARALALTRTGWSNPARLKRANLERVQYSWDGGTLRRIGWPVLDRGPNVTPAIQELLDGLTDVRVRFLEAGQWQSQWPPPGVESTDPWPRAVEVTLTGGEFGVVRRTLALVSAAAPVDTPGAVGEAPDG